MGKKSGPPAPPPPPDYTQDRQRAVESENQRRAKTAKAYNTAINYFNDQLSGYGGTLSQYEDQVAGLKLGDDLSGLSDLEKSLTGLERNFQNFSTGDVSFLDKYDPYSEVDKNRSAYEAAVKDYKDKYGDAVTPYNSAAGSNPSFQGLDIMSPIQASLANLMAQKNPGYTPPVSLPSAPYGSFVDPARPNINDYGGYSFGRAAIDQSLSGIELDAFGMPVKPNWQAAGTEFGGAVAYDMPGLNELNINLSDRYTNQIDDIQEAIDALQAQELAERGRISGFFDDYIERANAADIDVDFADINDDFSRYNRQLAEARNDINAFDSVLGFDDERQSALAELQQLEDLIAGRVSEQEAERLRINQFLTGREDDPTTPDVDESQVGVRSQLSEFDNMLRNMGIADLDEERATDILGQLSAQENALRGFESEMDFNFANEFADLYDLEDTVADLQRRRALEESRVADLTRDFSNRSDYLNRISGRTDRFNLGNIEDLQDALAALEAEIGTTTSDLDTDFSGATGSIADTRSALEELLNERNQEFSTQRDYVSQLLSGREDDPTTENIDESIMGLADIAEYDESGLMDRRAQIEAELAKLNAYQGGTSENVQAIQDAISQVDQRLRDLGGSRSGIEQDALTALQDIRNREYFTTADVDAALQEVEAIRQRAETFGATQAADELEALEQVLAQQSGRLAGDASEVGAREARERAEIEGLLDQFGNLQFPSVGDVSNVMTEEQLNAYLANLSEEDELYNLLNNSSFASNLLGAA